MFSPAFAPLANPEAIVNSKLVLAMLDAGWDVDVISRKLTRQTDYVYSADWEEPWTKLKDYTHVIDYNYDNRISGISESLWGGIKLGHVVDGCRWANYAYSYAMTLHKKKPYDVIMSRAFPQSAHLPALKMSKATGVHWVANWNDPWDFLRMQKIKGSLRKNIGFCNSRLAKSVAKDASLHTFPGEKLCKVMCSYLNLNTGSKCSVVPHIALPLKIKTLSMEKKTFCIGYLGRLGKQQDPTSFFEGLSTFIKMNDVGHQIRFRFVGIDDIGIQEVLRNLDLPIELEILGKCSYLDSLKHASSCDVLLVIDPQDTNGIIMTSKFVDYAQSGKPVLAITTPDSTIENIIMNFGGGIAADCFSSQAISEALWKLYDQWIKGTLDSTYSSEKLYNLFSPEKIISQYEKIFMKIGVK